jgi:hypothetical protein
VKPSLFLLLALLLLGCPPSPPPVPPTPDASDAASLPETAPAPPIDAAPPAPPTACAQACAALQAAGCVVQANCATVLSADTAARRFRNPKTGNALTCADLAVVKTAADVVALGQSCGPPGAAATASVITACRTSFCGGADTGEGACSCSSVAGNQRCWHSDADCAFDLACCAKPGASCTGSNDSCADATRAQQKSPKATKR